MPLRDRLLNFYGASKRVIAPDLKYSQSLYEDVLGSHVTAEKHWLDLGCGHHILPPWRGSAEESLVKNCRSIVGVDYDLHSLKKHRSISKRVRADISNLPFADQSFDLVTANMVVEHLADPEAQFREVNRVLRPGGTFIFHTPNAAGYSTVLTRLTPEAWKAKLIYILDGRQEDDVFSTHYKANSHEAIDGVAKSTGFKLQQMQLIVSDAMFGVVPPLAVMELLWIRLLMTQAFKRIRTNIIAVLVTQK